MLSEAVDGIVTDPPYGLGFMGKNWDHGIPGVPFWSAALRCAKPGAYLLAFGGTRTFHRLACAIEDAGWEMRDCLSWLYGSGFPKGKACLKPGWEPIILARKPGKSVHLQIDGCRVGFASDVDEDESQRIRTATPISAAARGRTRSMARMKEAGRSREIMTQPVAGPPTWC